MRKALAILSVAALCAGPALGVGVLVPKDEAVPPLAIKYLRVDATVEDQLAKTVVEQVFQNSTDRDLEAKYVFPLPAEAAVRDFAMWIDGKRTSGEIVEKGQAAQVYQSIVARLKDPGLLEYMDNNLFRANVYPVPKKGTVKIQIEYSQVVPMQDGLAAYTFPLRTGERASRTLEDFSVTVRLASRVALKSVYSPTHQVGIKRPDDHHATAGMEVDKAVLDRDFVLYYTVSDKEFGLNLITHRVKGEPGYFLLLIAPRTEVEEAKIQKKDVCFVLDVSGSMAGPKIEQARKALRYCVSKLRPQDRFGLISFSTETDAFAKDLLAANDENKRKAVEYVDKLEAQGGTDINAALAQALAMKPDTVVFLTDGKPTVGTTDPAAIVKNVEAAKGRARVFVFGVDEQVNTHLLDKISETTGGTREYVTPGEEIELKVTSFFNKASSPVLSRVSVDLAKADPFDVFPRELGDLFKGEQVLVVGRYKATGDAAVVLRGEIDGEKKSFTYEGSFPEEATGQEFIEGIWARRKVGFLLDQIRLHGENQELKDEVIRLSRKHNIITPYTSYLILESADQYKQHGIDTLGHVSAMTRPGWSADRGRMDPRGAGGAAGRTGGRPGPSAAPAPDAPARSVTELLERRSGDEATLRVLQKSREEERAGRYAAPSDADGDRRKAYDLWRGLSGARKDMSAESGESAMQLSEDLKRLRETKSARGDDGRDGGLVVTSRTVMGRTLVLYHGFWVDGEWTDKLERVTVKYASEAYFKLLAAEPKLKEVFKLGTRLIVVLPSKIALVVSEDEGQETLDDKAVQRLLAPAKE